MSLGSILGVVSETLEVAVHLLPNIVKLVQAIELPDTPGKGAAKKDAVLALLQSAIDALPAELKAGIGGGTEGIIKFAGSIIDVVVSLLNKIGIFKK